MTSLIIQEQHLDLGLFIDQSLSDESKSRVCRIARGVAGNAKLQKVCVIRVHCTYIDVAMTQWRVIRRVYVLNTERSANYLNVGTQRDRRN